MGCYVNQIGRGCESDWMGLGVRQGGAVSGMPSESDWDGAVSLTGFLCESDCHTREIW